MGESWELSVEPDFPSGLAMPVGGAQPAGQTLTLSHLIEQAPEGFLGSDRAAEWGSTGLLVKLLDAASRLSLQIHPSGDDPSLGPGESGKQEVWVILHAEPGAGVHLGLAEGVDETLLRSTLQQGRDLGALLNFVEVLPGDVLVIDAGIPHAVGAGITLIEPQRVLPGRRGVTYRYWDWDRRYDARGRLDQAGASRPLQLEQALSATRWDGPRGSELVEGLRSRHGPGELEGPAQRKDLLSDMDFPWVGVERLVGTGRVHLPPRARLRGLTVIEGRLTLVDGSYRDRFRMGETAALPAGLPGVEVELEAACALVSWIP